MSDTPIDTDLVEKSTTRKPAFMVERISEFREEYNENIRELPIEDEFKSTFLLESASDARRRLIDMGLAYYVEHGTPFGFSFDPEKYVPDDAQLACPECGETDPWMFRLGAQTTGTGEDTSISFEKARCLSCGITRQLQERTERHVDV